MPRATASSSLIPAQFQSFAGLHKCGQGLSWSRVSLHRKMRTGGAQKLKLHGDRYPRNACPYAMGAIRPNTMIHWACTEPCTNFWRLLACITFWNVDYVGTTPLRWFVARKRSGFTLRRRWKNHVDVSYDFAPPLGLIWFLGWSHRRSTSP